jgi:hypothetical protein
VCFQHVESNAANDRKILGCVVLSRSGVVFVKDNSLSLVGLADSHIARFCFFESAHGLSAVLESEPSLEPGGRRRKR